MLTAQEKFDERLYLWVLQDWKREIDEDFPLLGSIKDALARRSIRIIKSLNKEERRLMATALAKRARKSEVLTRCLDPLTEVDKKFALLFMDMLQSESWREASKIPLGGFRRRPGQKKAKRKKLKQCIIKALSPILGEDYENFGDWKVWRYHILIGPWQVVTYIDISGRPQKLSYEHNIIASEHFYLAQGLSILRWLGIGSQTEWQCLNNLETEPTSEALAKIIAHFMEAMPRLLEDLSPNLIK